MTDAISANYSSATFDQAMLMANNSKIEAPASSSTQSDADVERINAKAEEFEAVFISEMMSHVFEEIPVDEMFGGGKGEKMFRSMLTREYGKEMAAKGGIGLAKYVSEQMLQIQELHN